MSTGGLNFDGGGGGGGGGGGSSSHTTGGSFGGGGRGGGGGSGRPATLKERIIGCILCPPITCCVILCILFLIPVIVILSFLGNFNDHPVDWNTPMSMVIPMSSTLGGFGNGFEVSLQFNDKRDLPVEVAFLDTMPTLAGTRTVNYESQKLEKNDAQYFKYFLTPGSTVYMDVFYETVGNDTTTAIMSSLVLTDSQYKDFLKDPGKTITDGTKRISAQALLPNEINTVRHLHQKLESAAPIYFIVHFTIPTADSKALFLGGNVTTTIDQSYYNLPATTDTKKSCTLDATTSKCEADLNWRFAVLQSKSSQSSMSATYGESRLSYKYHADTGKIVGTIIGLVAALVCCLLVCCICFLAIVAAIATAMGLGVKGLINLITKKKEAPSQNKDNNATKIDVNQNGYVPPSAYMNGQQQQQQQPYQPYPPPPQQQGYYNNNNGYGQQPYYSGGDNYPPPGQHQQQYPYPPQHQYGQQHQQHYGPPPTYPGAYAPPN